MQIGDKVKFGGYDWLVLDIKDGAALIITEYIIQKRSYHNKYKDITWAECSLREYLNGEFYSHFSEADKQQIIPIVNTNLDNQWYGTNGGQDTEDRIFLLSLDEVACKYFGDSSAKLYSPKKNQRYWFERKDENNHRRGAAKDGLWWYWLRSPGRVGVKAVYVWPDGNIGIQGNNILKGNIADGECMGGVRPALWLKLR